jgi:hypothetical protein
MEYLYIALPGSSKLPGRCNIATPYLCVVKLEFGEVRSGCDSNALPECDQPQVTVAVAHGACFYSRLGLDLAFGGAQLSDDWRPHRQPAGGIPGTRFHAGEV